MESLQLLAVPLAVDAPDGEVVRIGDYLLLGVVVRDCVGVVQVGAGLQGGDAELLDGESILQDLQLLHCSHNHYLFIINPYGLTHLLALCSHFPFLRPNNPSRPYATPSYWSLSLLRNWKMLSVSPLADSPHLFIEQLASSLSSSSVLPFKPTFFLLMLMFILPECLDIALSWQEGMEQLFA